MTKYQIGNPRGVMRLAAFIAAVASLGFCSLVWTWELGCADFNSWIQQAAFNPSLSPPAAVTQPLQSPLSKVCLLFGTSLVCMCVLRVVAKAA